MGALSGRLLVALFLMAWGGVLLLNRLGLTDIDFWRSVGAFWPLLLVYFGASAIWHSVRSGQRVGSLGGLFVLALGIVLLGNNLGYEPLREGARVFWPLALVAAGLLVLVGGRGGFVGDIVEGGPSLVLQPGSYNMLFGNIRLDLRGAEIPEGETVVDVRGIAGDITVTVPADVGVAVDGFVVAGDLRLLGQKREGIMQSLQAESPGYHETQRRVRIRSHLWFGDVNIHRAS